MHLVQARRARPPPTQNLLVEEQSLVEAGAADAVAAAAAWPGAVADPCGAHEHGAPAAAAAAPPTPPPHPVPAAVVAADPGEDDPRHDGQPQDDRAVERLPAEPSLRRAQELVICAAHPLLLSVYLRPPHYE